MPLQSEASPDEESSPFYQENKRVCTKWESFILSHGGRATGKYNAWALIFHGEFKVGHVWRIGLKKSTVDHGSILLSSKKNLLMRTWIRTTHPQLSREDVVVRKRRRSDGLVGKIGGRLYQLEGYPRYTLQIASDARNPLASVCQLLGAYLSREEIEQVKYNQGTGELMIEFNILFIDFGMMKSLLENL